MRHIKCHGRRLRTIPAAVKDLKSQLPAPDKEGQRPHSPIEDDIKQLEKVRPVCLLIVFTASSVFLVLCFGLGNCGHACQLSIFLRIHWNHAPSYLGALLQERKELAGKDVKGVHHNWGSLLLGLGVLIAVVGPVNTYLRLGAT